MRDREALDQAKDRERIGVHDRLDLSARAGLQDLIACASPAYLERRGTPRVPTDLASHDCLGFIYASGAPFSEWSFSRDGETSTVQVPTRLQSNDARVLRSAALAGQGVLLQAERILEEDLASGRLLRILQDYATTGRPMHVLFSAGRRQRVNLRTFIDFVTDALREGPPR